MMSDAKTPAVKMWAPVRFPSKSRGSALLFTLIIVALLSLAAAAALKNAGTEQKMARNEQLRVDAQQRAQSLLDSTTSNLNNFNVSGISGSTNCLNIAGCDKATVAVDADLLIGAENNRSSVRIERAFPEFTAPPRGLSSSAGVFQVARFNVEANYDGSDALLGTATVGHTVMIMTVKGAQ